MEPTAFPEPAPLRQVTIHDPFWDPYLRLAREQVLPYQWETLNDRVPGAEPSHAVANFRAAAGLEPGEFQGNCFQDSDLAKWLEAVAYRLTTDPDPALEAQADAMIELIGKAQWPDGYLDTYYTVTRRDQRWTDERRRHELYVAGHMIEAAVAYHEATGKRAFLDIVTRLAAHIATVFGPGPEQKHGYPGHPGLELALVRLYRTTGDRAHLELARYFVDERGRQPHFYDVEAAARGAADLEDYFGDYVYQYTQAHRPVREQDRAVGHAVRAVYLYAGMADVARETGDPTLAQACRTLWRDVTRRQMYVTGAIGSSEYGEDFTFAYDLPNDRAYAETCAAIGLVFFAQRMLSLEPDGACADVIERALYNGILSGMSMDGKRFFYVNPLEVWPEACAARHDLRHVAPERQAWYSCACCPPNLARLLTSLGSYLYGTSPDTLWVHLYAGSTLETTVAGHRVRLAQTTAYPREETVDLQVDTDGPAEFTLALRLPGWCRRPALAVNGAAVDPGPFTRAGYARLERVWRAGDRIRLVLPMPVERIHAHPEVRADAGRVALQRGPVVYCLEEVDNGANLEALALPRDAALAVRDEPDLLGGVPAVTGPGLRTAPAGPDAPLYAPEPPREVPVQLRAVPYRLWGNRGKGEMLVWIREKA